MAPDNSWPRVTLCCDESIWLLTDINHSSLSTWHIAQTLNLLLRCAYATEWALWTQISSEMSGLLSSHCLLTFLPIDYLRVQNSFMLQGGIMILSCVKFLRFSLSSGCISSLMQWKILWQWNFALHRNCQTEVPSSPVNHGLQYI